MFVLVTDMFVRNECVSLSVPEEPMSIAPTISPKSTTKDACKLDTISADVQYTTAAYKNQLSAKTVSVEMTAIPPYGSSLHSDKILSPSATIKSLEKPLVRDEIVLQIDCLMSDIAIDIGRIYHIDV